MKEDSKTATIEIIVGSQSSVSWSKWYTEDPNERESIAKLALQFQQSTLEFRNSAKLSPKEENALQTTDSVKAYADLAAAEQQRWKTKGRRKVLDGMSTRLSYCQKLADNYKFIVDAVKSVHPQFVGAAWGTLGIFVQVLIQKNAKEEKFDSSLQSIVKSLPLLRAYEELYPTRRMRECMVNLYVKIMEFFQETYLYFKRPSWKRVVSAIIEPAEFKLTLLVDEIGNLSKEIQSEATIALSARDTRTCVEVIEDRQRQHGTELHEVRTVVKAVEKRVNDDEEIAIQTDLKAVTQLFVDSNYDSALNFSTYKTVTTIPRDTSEVQYSTQLQSRLTSETTPQMLWLMRDNYCQFPKIWLSRFVLDLCENLSKHSNIVISHFFSHTTISSECLVKQFCFELLSRDPRRLRACGDLEYLRSKKDLSTEELWKLSQNLIPKNQPVYWVLESFNECQYPGPRKQDSFPILFEKLADLILQRPNLRIIMTGNCGPKSLYGYKKDDFEAPEGLVQWMVGDPQGAMLWRGVH